MQVELSTQGEKMRSSVVIVLGLLIPGAAHCEVPAFVTYSGRLTDGTGWGESTEATLVFRLYDSATGGTPFWATTHPDVPVVDGYFTVNLGMCNADGSACTVNPAEATFPGDIPDQMWVGVEVGGVELERQPVGSVPYALSAERADYADASGTAGVATNSTAVGGVSASVLQSRALVRSAAAMCRTISGNYSGRVYPIPSQSTATAVCAGSGYGTACLGRVNMDLISDTKGTWTTEGSTQCSVSVGTNSGWYACCEY